MFAPPLNERQPRLDWPMLAGLAGLMVIGALFIASATLVTEADRPLALWQHAWFKQAASYGLGIVVAALLCLLPYHTLVRWSLVAYWLMILLLLAVLVVGASRFGARRWIDFGPVQFQPSEFAKLAFILALAHYLSRPPEELRSPIVFLKALGLTVLPFVLILVEPDLGSALVFLPIGLGMMYVAGVPTRYLWRLVGGMGCVVGLLLVDVLFAPPKWQFKLEPYQRRRLLVYFGKEFSPAGATEAERQRALKEQRDASYNVEQALISVGSGGLTGKGWRQGTQNALGYLPRAVARNDFIFSVIAEESGFVGSVLVLGLYTVVLVRGIGIAGKARDRLGRLVATGVIILWFAHVFINIGMNIRLMPVTGIPLPLLSYGGTSVLCSLIAAGLLQNVHVFRHHY
jgi:rod shape determining protein RodA